MARARRFAQGRTAGRRARTHVQRVAVGLAAVVLSTGSARGWGRVGHRAASELAAQRLTPAASLRVAQLLEPGESLADAALWADDHRREVAGSGAWHYVNVPLAEPRYDVKFCEGGACVVAKIGEMRDTLASSASSREDQQRALRFLVHLVEDLHQPTHVGDRGDRGGNDLPLVFFGQSTNLHRVWDDALIERHSADEALWLWELDRLARPETARQWSSGTVQAWATESLAAARAAYRHPTGSPLIAGSQLGAGYAALHLPVVRRRLAQSGVRLAAILNDLFR